MKRLLLLCMALLPLCGENTPQLERDLDQIAKTATIMIDGDLCQKILTARAKQFLLKEDPRDRWADADNYDVNDEPFIRTKKTLIRLSQLADYPVDVNLWMPVEANPQQIHIAIRNRYEMSQFWEWGKLRQEMPPLMRAVLETGRRQVVKQKPGFVSVLAPVRNSLGEVAGLVEVVSRVQPDPRENVK